MTKVCPVCGTTYPDTNAFCPADGSTLRVSESAENLIGSVVADRYLVTDLLGAGGMGKVYLARHVRLPQQVAIKILHPDLVRDPAAVARFNREASNASQIEQENVARVHDYGETADGLVYLAMEHVAGRTLREIIETEGPLAPRRTAELIRQIAAGLDAAHQLPRPLIHRDLKPDNVLVVRTASGRERVKVVDFGIAKAVGSDDNGLTKTGFVVGTPEFMSPEQLLGEPLDPRSDVYALALVAFQCLTGKLPFEMTTPERARIGRLLEPPRHLLETRPGIDWPASLEAVFDDALSRDPQLRPASAGEFADRFSQAIDEEWPATGRSPMATPMATRVPTPAAMPAVPAAATPVPTTPVPLASTPPSAPPSAPAPGPRMVATRDRSTGSRGPLAVAGGLLVVALVGGVLFMSGRGRGAPAASPDSVRTPAATAVAPPPVPTVDSAPAPPAETAKTASATGALAVDSTRRRESRNPVTDSAAGEPGKANDVPPPRGARGRLDALLLALEGDGVQATDARAYADSIRALLPRLGRDDGVRAQIGLVRAAVLAGDVAGACEALRAAGASARRSEQREEIQKLNEQLGCD